MLRSHRGAAWSESGLVPNLPAVEQLTEFLVMDLSINKHVLLERHDRGIATVAGIDVNDEHAVGDVHADVRLRSRCPPGRHLRSVGGAIPESVPFRTALAPAFRLR